MPSISHSMDWFPSGAGAATAGALLIAAGGSGRRPRAFTTSAFALRLELLLGAPSRMGRAKCGTG